jgi:hypothetical protein
MANFHTHITVAAVSSMTLGAILNGAGLASAPHTLLYIGLGTIGGIMPDVDSDNSTSIKIIFSLLAAIIAFMVMFAVIHITAILVALALWAFIFVMVRYGAIHFFKRVTEHRGIIHSVPMGLLVGLITTIISYAFIKEPPYISWLCGAFVSFGFFVHLILDELYSVNLAGVTMKKSFGSALTIFSSRTPLRYIFMYTLVIVVFFLAPNYKTITASLLNKTTVHKIQRHLLPKKPSNS